MDNLQEKQILTPLRRFINSIGLDYTKLTLRQMRKWSSTKRYKDYLALRKIKRMADEAHVSEELVEMVQEELLVDFYFDDIFLSVITENEVYSVICQLHHLREGSYHSYKRGKYKTLEQRKKLFKDMVTSALYAGSHEATIGHAMFKSMGKHTALALQKGRSMLLKRREKPEGTVYHRKVYRLPGSGGGY
jgi:hypothetical protein